MGSEVVTAQVVDYCPGCAADWVGLSPAAFEVIAPVSDGLVDGVTWVVD